MPSDRGMEHGPIPPASALADADGARLEGAVLEHPGEGLPRPRRGARGNQKQVVPETAAGWWETEPDVGRVAHGVPARVDRLRCLGNAVVPQVVEVIGRAIVERMSV
jgi:site-specific DNA-cytosine methylase